MGRSRPGFQGPLGDFVIKLDNGLPLAKLNDINAKWPELAKNQSPTELGYRFRGYKLNAAGQPTFNYEFDSITVSDAFVPRKDGFDRMLTVANVKPSEKGEIVLRLARGAIQKNNDTYVINNQLKATITGAEARIIEVAGSQELRAVLKADQRIEVRLTW